jgi:hypothetical protein
MVILTVFKDKREGGQRARCVRRRWEGRGRQRNGKIDNSQNRCDERERKVMGKVLGMAWEDTGNGLWLSVSRKEIC